MIVQLTVNVLWVEFKNIVNTLFHWLRENYLFHWLRENYFACFVCQNGKTVNGANLLHLNSYNLL